MKEDEEDEDKEEEEEVATLALLLPTSLLMPLPIPLLLPVSTACRISSAAAKVTPHVTMAVSRDYILYLIDVLMDEDKWSA